MKWIRDQRVEHHLKRMGIEFSTATVQIDDIDLEESLNRQVRVGKKINDDWVTEYGLAMLEPGSAFPMPILNKLKNLIWIWSGNHRVHAAKQAGLTSVEAYMVSVTDPRLQDVIPRVVNSWEGRRPTREELLINASYMIENHKMEIKEVARMLSLRYDWIVTYMRTQRLAQEIRSQGINPNGFSRSLLTKMSPLSSDINTLKETARFFHKYPMTSDDQNQILEDMKAQDTEKARLQVLKDWEVNFKIRAEPKKLPFSTKTRSQFLKVLSQYRNFIMKINKNSELQLAPEDTSRVAQYWNDIETRMHKLMREEELV